MKNLLLYLQRADLAGSAPTGLNSVTSRMGLGSPYNPHCLPICSPFALVKGKGTCKEIRVLSLELCIEWQVNSQWQFSCSKYEYCDGNSLGYIHPVLVFRGCL